MSDDNSGQRARPDGDPPLVGVLESLLGLYLGSLWREGKRLARLRVLQVTLQALHGGRKLVLFYFLAFLASLVLTAAFFSAVIYSLVEFQQTGTLTPDVFLIVDGAVIVVAAAAVFWSLREKRWLKAFHADRYFEEVRSLSRHLPPEPATPFSDIDKKALSQLIDLLVKEKITEHLRRTQAASSGNSRAGQQTREKEG